MSVRHTTVEELAQAIRLRVAQVPSATVSGTVGRVSVGPTGHVYFDLHGTSARVSCVAWSSSNVVPTSGPSAVRVQRIDFYPPRGTCQAVITAATLQGESPDARAQFIARLHKEGLITRPRRCVPEVVTHLCLITSRESAAAHDMIAEVGARWPGLRVTLVHAQVQGGTAPTAIVRAFDAVPTLKPPVDLIVCGRGGGSEADLTAFDSEEVVRSFASASAAVICAVGHENDHCVADLVADVRAKTPTAAIQVALPQTQRDRADALGDLREGLRYDAVRCAARLLAAVAQLRRALHAAQRSLLDVLANRCRMLRSALQLASTSRLAREATTYQALRHRLHGAAQRSLHAGRQHARELERHLGYLTTRILEATDARIRALRGRLEGQTSNVLRSEHARITATRATLVAKSPQAVLERGFAYVCKSGKPVRRRADVNEGDQLAVRLADGVLDVLVKRRRTHA